MDFGTQLGGFGTLRSRILGRLALWRAVGAALDKNYFFFIKTKIFYIVHISSELAYVKKIPNKKSSPRKRHDHGTTNTIDEQ